MAEETVVTNQKTSFDNDVNDDYTVFTDEVFDANAGTTVKKQLVGLVSGDTDSAVRIPGTATFGLLVEISRVGSANLSAAAQVTVTGSATVLIAANSARTGLTIRSLSTNTQSIFYGIAGVTTTTGMEVKPGETVSWFPGEVPHGQVVAIATSGSQVVIVQESA